MLEAQQVRLELAANHDVATALLRGSTIMTQSQLTQMGTQRSEQCVGCTNSQTTTSSREDPPMLQHLPTMLVLE